MHNQPNPEVEAVFAATVTLFKNAGFQVSMGSNSVTDYGHSRYMYVNYNNALSWNIGLGAQIRVSDHCTGDRRILNGDESFIMVSNAEANLAQVFHKFNYFFKPCEYAIAEKEVSAMLTKTNVRTNELRADDVVVDTRTTKKGEVMHNVQRMTSWTVVSTKHIATGYVMPSRVK